MKTACLLLAMCLASISADPAWASDVSWLSSKSGMRVYCPNTHTLQNIAAYLQGNGKRIRSFRYVIGGIIVKTDEFWPEEILIPSSVGCYLIPQ